MTELAFTRLTNIDPDEIASHMNDPRMAEHMPLLTGTWDKKTVTGFVQYKESYWERDGLGHWAILKNGSYQGWGGFQKEKDGWDYGLVLKPASFGLGARITKQALEFARSNSRITFVTFLLPPSRKKLSALKKLGARFVGDVTYEGETFCKFRLDFA